MICPFPLNGEKKREATKRCNRSARANRLCERAIAAHHTFGGDRACLRMGLLAIWCVNGGNFAFQFLVEKALTVVSRLTRLEHIST